MPLLVAALLGIAAVLIVIYPLLGFERLAEARQEGQNMREAADTEHAARISLRDVEFDFRLGNLDDGDYHALRSVYEGRALQALKQRYDEEQALDAVIDAELQILRDTQPSAEATTPRQAGNSHSRGSSRARRRRENHR